MANREAPNTLLSDARFRILDLVCQGPISGFVTKPGTYGTDPLVSTWYDDVPVRNLDGSYNFDITGDGYSFNWTRGFASQSGISGFQKVEALIPLSSNTRVANPPEGAGPFKPLICSFTSNMYPDADSIKVTVRVPALYAQDNEANTSPYQIDYAVDISLNNGAWVTVGTHTIAGKCTSAYQKTTFYQLPKATPAAAYYEWKVRVRRVSQNILSIRTQNELFVDSVSVVSASLYAYPNSVIVGTEIGAEQFSSVPARAYEIAGLLVSVPSGYTPTQYGYDTATFTRQCDVANGDTNIGMTTQEASQLDGITAGMGVAGAGIPAGAVVTSVALEPQWSFSIDLAATATNNNTTLTFTPTAAVQSITAATYPDVWLGNFVTGVWTDNPAWVFYDIMTNPVYGLGDVVDPAYTDKWTLYKVSQYCDAMVDDGNGGLEPRFTCNVSIEQPEDAYTVLLNLASTFRGMLYYANGGIHPSQQQDESPVTHFTNANVVNGVFNYSDTARNTRATVAEVKWVDPQNGYRENVEYIEDIDGILKYGYQKKEMTAFACTSKGQAYRLGSWTLESERLLTETVTFQTAMEGVTVRPGDNFAIYDNFRNNRNQAGRILGIAPSRSQVITDRSVVIEPNQVYSLTAIIPKAQFDATGDITGSNQIPLIRQPQIETFAVTTAATSGTTMLTVAGQFSTGLFIGSPFVLSSSGVTGNIFTQASFYTCLATAEVQPGVIEVLGLEANTGVQYSIQTGYSIIDWPANSGDFTTSILPPTNLRVTGVTGVTDDNTFFSSINLTWQHSPSPDLACYIVSGKEWDTAYERFEVFDTGFNYTRADTGQYLFKVAALSNGGRLSTFITGGLLIGSQNPLGTLRPLSGVRLSDNYDPLYVNATTGYTGYVGINPGFSWQVLYDDRGQPVVDAQFISGYQIVARSLNGVTGFFTGELSGASATAYQFTGDTLRTWPGNPRGWEFAVRTIDIYGNVADGAAIKVNNPPMKPPFASGFVGFNGGISYNVMPSLQYDTSGIYLWVDQNPAFTPTYDNYDFVSSNLAGGASIAPSTGSFWTWFSLSDTFNRSGNPIFGPISGNANQMFDAFDLDISTEINNALNDISGAFLLITGQITNSINVVSGENALTLQTVQGLSGQITGNGTIPGAVNTALNVRVNTIVVNASGSLSQQIDAVSARLQTTGANLNATVGTVSTALTNTGVALGQQISVVTSNYQLADNALSTRVTATGANLLSAMSTADGALSQWITNLGAQTSGQSSSVQIGARAFVTGSVNGLGGAAVASWGFRLDANGKVVSMVATSADWEGGGPVGTIAFGGANLQSNTFTAGSAGWQIKYDGSAEFNNISARGAFTGGAGSYLAILDGSTFSIGAPAGNRFSTQVIPGVTDARVVSIFNTSNIAALTLQMVSDHGEIYVKDSAGNSNISMNGLAGSINCDTLDVDSTSNFDGDMTFPGTQKLKFTNGGNTAVWLDESNGLQLHGDTSHPVRIRGAALLLNESAAGSYTAGYVYDLNGDQIMAERYGTSAPADGADAVANWCKACLLHHGLGA